MLYPNELLSQYAAGRRNFRSSVFQVAVDLEGCLLAGCDLSDAQLQLANLRSANLARSQLVRAILSGADLSQANLSQSDLSNAQMIGVNLSRANLSRANLSGTLLCYGADLTGACLSYADLTNALLIDANLTQANLSGAVLKGTVFLGATMPDGQLFVQLEYELVQQFPLGRKFLNLVRYTDESYGLVREESGEILWQGESLEAAIVELGQIMTNRNRQKSHLRAVGET